MDASVPPNLQREIGLLGLTSITVGGIIGPGIFALAATMGAVAGPEAVVALALLGVVVILMALPYAELSAAYPSTGGPYSLPRRALEEFAGFRMGWGDAPRRDRHRLLPRGPVLHLRQRPPVRRAELLPDHGAADGDPEHAVGPGRPRRLRARDVRLGLLLGRARDGARGRPLGGAGTGDSHGRAGPPGLRRDPSRCRPTHVEGPIPAGTTAPGPATAGRLDRTGPGGPRRVPSGTGSRRCWSTSRGSRCSLA